MIQAPLLLAALLISARAEPPAGQPYIDKIKQQLRDQDAEERGDAPELPARTPGNPDPFIQQRKKEIADEQAENGPQPSGSYIERLKRENPEKFAPATDASYIQELKAKLPPDERGSAIQAYKEGRSELEFKRPGEIHHAGFLHAGTSLGQAITLDSRDFTDVYGTDSKPELMLGYEYQFFNHDYAGSLGIVARAGLSVARGKGKFLVAPKKAGGVEAFSSDSEIEFRLFTLPTLLGVSYRMKLLRYVQPYVQAGPALIGFYEDRKDEGDPKRSYAIGYGFTGGIALLLDWLSRDTAWDAYANSGVMHTYLTAGFNQTSTFMGDVSFNASSINGGITFEF